jgi:hypothetical protein
MLEQLTWNERCAGELILNFEYRCSNRDLFWVNISAFAQNNIISYRDDVLAEIRKNYLRSEIQRRCWYSTRTERGVAIKRTWQN